MCGIIGYIHKESDSHRKQFNMGISHLHHRGPDSNGVFSFEEGKLGHTRLAIIDLSLGGHQPKSDVTGRYTITFNGEIYNYQDLKLKINYPYESSSDTEVILAVYSKFGYDTPKYLKGQFAFAIWDNVKQELFIARDRLGEKPFYYSRQDNGSFYFASEIRALIELLPHKVELNINAIQEYLLFQCVHGSKSLLKNICTLNPGHFAIISNSNFVTKSYWHVWDPSIEKSYADLSTTKQTVAHLLNEAIKGQMISDVPLGAFLSGGIDSSAIVGLMAQNSENPVQTFNVSFDNSQFDESPYARIISKKFNTNHYTINLKSEEFKKQIPEILSNIDNPSADGPNTYVVSEAVKRAGITVALSGLGGDELFAGYGLFKHYYLLNKYAKIWDSTTILRSIGANFFDGKKKALLQLKNTGPIDFYSLSRQLFSLQETIALLPRAEKTNDTHPLSYLNHGEFNKLPSLSKMSVLELSSYTSHVLLKDTDQMSMAHSLEVRVPFFDHDLVNYVIGIPDQYKYPKYPKSLLVESLGNLLPKEIVQRPKMGFSFPWAEWMRSNLKAYCEDSLNDLGNRPDLFDKEVINGYWLRFLNGDKSVKWSKIWLLVSLEQWLKNIGYAKN